MSTIASLLVLAKRPVPNPACDTRRKPSGWPDACANCGAHWSWVGFDHADGFNCQACGATDADNEGGY